MKSSSILATGFFILFCYFLTSPGAFANPTGDHLSHLYINQRLQGGVPNLHDAFFHFFNEDANPLARVIRLGDSTVFDPESVVELNPGQSALASTGWLMFVIQNCQNQVVRPIVDFDSPQCQIPNADPDTMLSAVLSLPEECLGAPVDACQLYDGDLHLDFGTSLEKARETLNQDVKITYLLDGKNLSTIETLHPYHEALPSSGNPEDPVDACDDDLHYSPIYAYFAYGYSIPIQTGSCIGKLSAATITPIKVKGKTMPLAQGPHDLDIILGILEDTQDFPVKIFQD
jgi:hypothetical protein